MCFDGFIYRGDEFQIAFAQIIDLSIVPDDVNVVALTGTATPQIYSSVVRRLSLKDPFIVGLSPS